MKSYPFVIKTRVRGKLRKVMAESFEQALNKILSVNPGHRVSTKFARSVDGLPYHHKEHAQKSERHKIQPFIQIINTMDLIEARVKAAATSLKEKKKIYIVVDKEGECLLKSIPDKNPELNMAAFVNGSEVKVTSEEIETSAEAEVTKISQVKKKTPLTKTKVQPKKKTKMAKTATKTPAKNLVKKSSEERIARGNNMHLTATEWKKVDAILKKEEISFSAWSRGLVLAKIK